MTSIRFILLCSILVCSLHVHSSTQSNIQKVTNLVSCSFYRLEAQLNKIASKTGILSSLFVLYNGAFIRVATSDTVGGVIGYGTVLADTAIVNALLANQIFSGTSVQNGITYNVYYKPLVSAEGAVIGAAGTGVPV